MAASWCHLRLWYSKTGEKLYKANRRLLNPRQPISHRVFIRTFSPASYQKDNFLKIIYDLQTEKGQKKDTKLALPPVYSPHYVEAVWYDWWLSQGYFDSPTVQAADNATDRQKFVMLLPPPNVTGTLHLGHALTNSIQDALVRWHRMRGDVTIWIPGTDHAGIATQAVVEKTLWAQRQQTRRQLGRQNFESEVWKWRQEKGNVIEEQMKSLGSSFDWSRNFFTLDERLSRSVTEAFLQLYEKGKVYREKQLVNWSCSLQSSISDIEVDSVTVEGRSKHQVPGYAAGVEFGVLSSFAYPVEDSDEEIVVSTTRLETMLGDTAVAVHPEDPRYTHLIGRRVRHPLSHRTLPVVADPFVDREFGSGAVKITPAHDHNDLEVGRRHELPELNVLDDQGQICGEVPAEFVGMPRFAARETVRAALVDLKLYRGEVDHTMVLPVCSRSGDVVEPRLKEQWFLSCKEMAERALQAVQKGELILTASHHEAVWHDWLTNKCRDWCLSRQLWWGHRIPAYRFQTDEKEVWLAARSEAEAIAKFSQQHPGQKYHSVSQDEDVLDTWFSSALLPFTVFGWPEKTDDLRQFYPLSLMETGHDILFFWVARMVMLGLELTDTLPFKHVLLHGIVRDAHGRKMSKSLGNVIDPMDVINGISLEELQNKLDSTRLSKKEIKTACDGLKKDFPQGIPECGTDAVRFTLCSYDFKVDAVQMNVLHTRTYLLFCNKIWQAFRFTQQYLHEDFVPLHPYTFSGHEDAIDMWILSRLSEMVSVCDKAFTSHSLQVATKALHQFWLTQFCDVYVECCKVVFQSDNGERQAAVRQILHLILDTYFRALSPFMPFLAEELFQRLPARGNDWPESVCIAPYPQPHDFQWQNKEVESEMSQVLEMCHHVLHLRHEYNLKREFLPVYIVVKSKEDQEALSKYKKVLYKLCKADPVHVVTDAEQTVPDGCATTVLNSQQCQLHVELKGYVDFSRELERLSQKHDKLEGQQQDVAAKLSELIKKGRGDRPAAQRLQAKEQSLMAKLKIIKESMENVNKMLSS